MFICKEGENEETPPYAVETSSVLSILSEKILAVQAMKMWSQGLNYVLYYKWILGDTVNLGYLISINVLGMSEETTINLLHSKPNKDVNIRTGQYF